MEKTRCAGMAVLALTAALLAPAAHAATRTVTSLADNGGPHTLRSLINAASAGETIVFSDDLSGTITLNCSLFPLQIKTNLTIAGPGPAMVTVSGGNACGVFGVGPNVTATISGLTIANGSNDGGGGIGNSGTLTVNHCVLKNNSSTVFGGGILNGGTLTVTNSTVSGNSAPSGGGIADVGGKTTVRGSTFTGNSAFSNNFGGGIASLGNLIVNTSTFASNFAGAGGAVYGGFATTIVNSTFSGNTAAPGSAGGAVWNDGTMAISNSTFSFNTLGAIADSSGSALIKGSLLANESALGGNCAVPVASAGYNLSDDLTCGFGLLSDKNGIAAGLDPLGLQNNGGPTQTISLLPTSPAVNAIPEANCTDTAGNKITTDQRGVKRPQKTSCDTGALELIVVPIDIDPDLRPGIISSSSRGTVPLAIFFTRAFGQSALLNRASLTFGKTGNEKSLVNCAGADDNEGDDSSGLLCFFSIPLTGFHVGDTTGILKGQTREGFTFAGSDSLVVIR